MPHQCVRCSRIIPMGSKELLEGCMDCKAHFFFYIKEEQLEKLKENPIEIPKEDKEQVEKDIREMAGIIDEDAPAYNELGQMISYRDKVVNLTASSRTKVITVTQSLMFTIIIDPLLPFFIAERAIAFDSTSNDTVVRPDFSRTSA